MTGLTVSNYVVINLRSRVPMTLAAVLCRTQRVRYLRTARQHNTALGGRIDCRQHGSTVVRVPERICAEFRGNSQPVFQPVVGPSYTYLEELGSSCR